MTTRAIFAQSAVHIESELITLTSQTPAQLQGNGSQIITAAHSGFATIGAAPAQTVMTLTDLPDYLFVDGVYDPAISVIGGILNAQPGRYLVELNFHVTNGLNFFCRISNDNPSSLLSQNDSAEGVAGTEDTRTFTFLFNHQPVTSNAIHFLLRAVAVNGANPIALNPGALNIHRLV